MDMNLMRSTLVWDILTSYQVVSTSVMTLITCTEVGVTGFLLIWIIIFFKLLYFPKKHAF